MKHSEAFEKLVDEVRPHIKEVQIEDVLAWRDEKKAFTFIDVREDHEWCEGHAPGAIHLGRGIIERDIEKVCPDKGAMIVLYCGGGFRSALSAYNLQKMGYTNIISMDGGIRGWRERKLPEVKEEKA